METKIPKFSLEYDEKRDSFYIDCGSVENACSVLNLIAFAVEQACKSQNT